MAKSVSSAFSQFLKNSVNLGGEDTKKARTSRDWLKEKILNFPSTVDKFPSLYSGQHIYFGSFARKTKKQPIDDIDMMICIYAGGTYYEEQFLSIEMKVPETNNNKNLKNYCNPGTNILNSTKLTNKLVAALKTVPQYKSSETKRDGEAASLKLISYDWNFDIVPCFKTNPENNQRTYYLIPDGKGNWKKTDPRIDQNRVSDINQRHNGQILDIIRIMKYWNRRATMVSMSSYLLETIILNYYQSTIFTASQYIDIELPKIFDQIGSAILSDVMDPKEIEGNINRLSQDERNSISNRAFLDHARSQSARNYENQGDQESSIKKWGEIFGPKFPDFG